MEKKIFKVLRLIDREVAKLEMDNIQMSDIYNRNPKGKEIDRLKTIAQILEEAIR